MRNGLRFVLAHAFATNLLFAVWSSPLIPNHLLTLQERLDTIFEQHFYDPCILSYDNKDLYQVVNDNATSGGVWPAETVLCAPLMDLTKEHIRIKSSNAKSLWQKTVRTFSPYHRAPQSGTLTPMIHGSSSTMTISYFPSPNTAKKLTKTLLLMKRIRCTGVSF